MAEQIEKVTSADIDDIKQIELDCALSSWTRDDYLKETDREDSLFLLAKKDSVILGFVIARLIMTEIFNSHFNEIEIYNIAVRAESRHQKVGSKLLEEIFKFAENSNVQTIHLEVRRSNSSAISFYRKIGFESIGVRKNFYSNPLEDAVLMRRTMDFRQNA